MFKKTYSILYTRLFIMIIQDSKLKKGLPKTTLSLCPECIKKIPADIYEEGGKVLIRKECPEHGEFKDVYWSDVDMYLMAEKYAHDGVGLMNPQITDATQCPEQCGLCNLHLTNTNLANVDLTNRCNLNCPICFANANDAGYVYEPHLEQLTEMLKMLRAQEPVPCPAVQFSGGEPTIYPDYFKVLSIARELGFPQIQIATNGILLAKDPEFAQKSLDAGLHTVYLQFDGLDEEIYKAARGLPLLEVKKQAIENCRNTKPKPLSTILVPTVVKGVNSHQVGAMLDFAIERPDVIRGVNFQPVAFTGRIDYEERTNQRITLPDLVNLLVEQTDYLNKDDFFSVPVVTPVSELVSALSREPKMAFTTHPHCGIATFLIIDGKRVIPIPKIVDIPGIMERMEELAKKASSPLGQIGLRFYGAMKSDKAKREGAAKQFQKYFGEFIDENKLPHGFNLVEALGGMLAEGAKDNLGEFTWQTLFVGGMHFQDNYNYDIQRVMRCAIHYATPDNRIIPFCAYNGGPTYRTEVEKKFSVPLDEWNKRNKGTQKVSE
jgi:uncharacterized radical SAM superfamily Fe-S cluster-containing enzyme